MHWSVNNIVCIEVSNLSFGKAKWAGLDRMEMQRHTALESAWKLELEQNKLFFLHYCYLLCDLV